MQFINKILFHINQFKQYQKLKGNAKNLKDRTIAPTVDSNSLHEYNKGRNKKKKMLLCFAPFSNLYFSSKGAVGVCCHNRKYTVGNYPEESILDIWNGEKINLLRKHIVNNNLSLGCQFCQYDFDKKRYNSLQALHFDQIPLNSQYPSMMEFELDITCNLECKMCNGDFSSLIRKKRDNLPPLEKKYDDNFVEELKPFFKHLKEARFSGGEPFLIEIYYKIWKSLIEINPSCLIIVQSNGTVLNEKVKSILNDGRFEIGVSLDSIEKKNFEAIRKNAKYETVINNINYFSEYCKRKKTSFRLSICVMRNNWSELPKYINYCNKLNAYASFHRVEKPETLSLKAWDYENLQKAYEHLSLFDCPSNSNLEITNKNHYESFLKLIKQWVSDKEATRNIESSLKHLTTNEIKDLIVKKVNQFIKQSNYDDIKKETLLEKNAKVMDALPLTTKANILINILNTDTKLILASLNALTVEQLITQMEDFIKVNEDHISMTSKH